MNCESLIILAGKDNSQTFSGQNDKCNLTVNGTTILSRIIEAVEDSDIQNVCFVGSEQTLKTHFTHTQKEYLFAQPGKTLSESLLNGIDTVAQKTSALDRTLAIASDLPFLTTGTLNWLAHMSDKEVDDLIIPQVSRSKMLGIYQYYSSYYWPMVPEPFKWGDGINFKLSKLGSKLTDFIDTYRAKWNDKIMITAIKRLKMMYGMGAKPLMLLAANYISKYMQIHLNTKFVPFSSQLSASDYTRTLERITGLSVKVADAPNIDLCLDVDNPWRLNVFNMRYKEIRKVVDMYNETAK